MKAKLIYACLLVLCCWTPVFAELDKSPENPSILLFAGGAAVLAWRYYKNRLRR